MSNGKKPIEIADEYIERANQAFDNNDFSNALIMVQDALEIYWNESDFDKYAYNLNTLGVFYAAAGVQSTSIDCYIDGLEFCEEHGINKYHFLFYNNIGTTFCDLEEYDMAIDYFETSKKYVLNHKSDLKDRYDLYLLIAYMNLCDSYRCAGDLEKAMEYMKLSESIEDEESIGEHEISFLVMKCQVLWAMGEKDYVYSQEQTIVNGIITRVNILDYVQDIKSSIDLFCKMGAFESWRKILEATESYVDEQGIESLKIFIYESWLTYYKVTGDEESYVNVCVAYAEYNQSRRAIEKNEKVSAINMKMRIKKEERERRLAERASYLDGLTQTYNRHKFATDLDKTINRCIENNTLLGIGILDVDSFKEINDRYGHTRGDECLIEVASYLKDILRGIGYVYRFGGDEFVIIIEDGTKELLSEVGSKIKNKLSNHTFSGDDAADDMQLTVSQGYASIRPEKGMSEQDLLDYVDKAMYYVKEHGKNDFHIV